MKYQVAETTRLRQISCEIFVVEGLEGALNIDRESYNFAHTHVVRLTNWLHTALSRSIGTQKNVASTIRRRMRNDDADRKINELEGIVSEFWRGSLGADSDSPIPPVVWGSAQGQPGSTAGDADAIKLSRSVVAGSTSSSVRRHKTETQIAAIAQILAGLNMLDHLDENEIEYLMASVAKIIMVDE